MELHHNSKAGRSSLAGIRVVSQLFRQSLSKLLDPMTGDIQVGVGFRKAESNEPMTIVAGEKRFAGYAGHTGFIEQVQGARFARLTRKTRHIG